MSLVIFDKFIGYSTQKLELYFIITVLFYVTCHFLKNNFSISHTFNKIYLTLQSPIYSIFKRPHTPNHALRNAVLPSGMNVMRQMSLWFSLLLKD
ncbi:hypothetical protein CRM93_09890 [Acetobacter fabarum]|nr:hypothetical protein CRM93_09890 [Acetobacter fabarum]